MLTIIEYLKNHARFGESYIECTQPKVVLLPPLTKVEVKALGHIWLFINFEGSYH